MSKKRWFVVRPIKLNSGEIPWGVYLTDEQAAEIPKDLYRVLVRNVRLFDTTGEVDIPWRERNKLKLRHRAFTEIGSAEAKRLHDLSIEWMAQGRVAEFQSPREKALAEEIKEEKVETPPVKTKKKKAESKPKRRKKVDPAPAPEEKKEELFIELPEV